MTNHTAPAGRFAIYVQDFRSIYRADRLDGAKTGFLANEQYDDLCSDRRMGMVFDNFKAAVDYIVSRGWLHDTSIHVARITAYPVEVY